MKLGAGDGGGKVHCGVEKSWRKPQENLEKTPRKLIFSEIKALVLPRAGRSSNIHMDGESKVKAAEAKKEVVGFGEMVPGTLGTHRSLS